MRQTILIMAAAFLLQACSSFELGDANKLQKGMTQRMVESLVSKGPRSEFTIAVPSAPGDTFNVMLFDLKLGGIQADYLAIFRNDALLYWGHPYEFNRHPDKLINEIGRIAVERSSLF